VTAFLDLLVYFASLKCEFKEGTMKKLLIASAALAALIGTPALAADLAIKAPLPPAPPAWSWTGFYVGVNAGYSLAKDPFTQTLDEGGIGLISGSVDSRVTPNGGLFGGQAGYNYQAGNIVVGVEGDMQWSGARDTAGCGIECLNEGGMTATLGTAEQRIKWFGTARGRVGYTNNDWLLYVTAGGAWGGIDATTAVNGSAIGLTAASNTTSFTKTGGAFGGGVEVHLGGQWTAKAEYLYMDLGNINDTLNIPGGLGGGPAVALTTNSKVQDNIVRAGLNFKIN
jgi:outer membrane immunogenic protein